MNQFNITNDIHVIVILTTHCLIVSSGLYSFMTGADVVLARDPTDASHLKTCEIELGANHQSYTFDQNSFFCLCNKHKHKRPFVVKVYFKNVTTTQAYLQGKHITGTRG